VVASNSISSQLMNYGALYVDMGASGITFRENVISDVPRWVFAHSPLSEKTLYNTCSDRRRAGTFSTTPRIGLPRDAAETGVCVRAARLKLGLTRFIKKSQFLLL